MTDIADIERLRILVLWAAFAVSAAFGFLAQRTRFCTMGAISDIVGMGSWTRLRVWVMAVAVAMIGFHLMGWLGWIDIERNVYAMARIHWLSAVLGGLLFGVGMVLASGCGSRTLMRMGSGSLKALVVFFVMGLFAYATLRGVLAVVRVETVDLVAFDVPWGGTLSQWLAETSGLGVTQSGLLLASVIGIAALWWVLVDREIRQPSNWVGGLGIGLVLTLMWWISGHLGHVSEHPLTLESVYVGTNSVRNMEALTFTAPVAYALEWLTLFSDTSRVLTLGVASVFGVVAGAMVEALMSRSFRWEGFRGTQDTALHLVGAACMGVGGVTAMGCSIGQGLSGLSTLSVTSAIAVTGIVAGAWLGLRFQMWLIGRE